MQPISSRSAASLSTLRVLSSPPTLPPPPGFESGRRHLCSSDRSGSCEARQVDALETRRPAQTEAITKLSVRFDSFVKGGGGAVTRRHAWLFKKRCQLKSRDFRQIRLTGFRGLFDPPTARYGRTGLFFDTGSRLLVKPQKYNPF